MPSLHFASLARAVIAVCASFALFFPFLLRKRHIFVEDFPERLAVHVSGELTIERNGYRTCFLRDDDYKRV